MFELCKFPCKTGQGETRRFFLVTRPLHHHCWRYSTITNSGKARQTLEHDGSKSMISCLEGDSHP